MRTYRKGMHRCTRKCPNCGAAEARTSRRMADAGTRRRRSQLLMDFVQSASQPHGMNHDNKWRRPTHVVMAGHQQANPGTLMVGRGRRRMTIVQHSCAKDGQMVEAVLETAVRLADMVLVQEPRRESRRDSPRSHPRFRWIKGKDDDPAKCRVVVNKASSCQIPERGDFARNCGNYVQVSQTLYR
jgi:hypothetical protein